MKRSVFSLFSIGKGGPPAKMARGPLTPRVRAKADVPARLKKRKEPDSELLKRLIFADQTGELPGVLARYLPNLASAHVFQIADAKAMGAEIGANVLELVEAGLRIEGLSRQELSEFVALRQEASTAQEIEDDTEPPVQRPVRADSPSLPNNTTSSAKPSSAREALRMTSAGDQSPIFDLD